MQIRQFRWWAPQDIAKSPDVFAPRQIAHHRESLFLSGPPENPIDVGI
jgi:hypothetical protein